MRHRVTDRAHQLYVEASVDPIGTPAGAIPPYDVGLHVIPLKLTQDVQVKTSSGGDLSLVVCDILYSNWFSFLDELGVPLTSNNIAAQHEDYTSLETNFSNYGTISFAIELYDLGPQDTRSGKFAINVGTMSSLTDIGGGYSAGEYPPDIIDLPYTKIENVRKATAVCKSTDTWHTNSAKLADVWQNLQSKGITPSSIIVNGMGLPPSRDFRLIITHHIWAIPRYSSLHIHNAKPSFPNPNASAVATIASRKLRISKISTADAVNFAYDNVMPILASASPNSAVVRSGAQLAKPVLDYIAQYIDKRFNLKSVYKQKSKKTKKKKTI